MKGKIRQQALELRDAISTERQLEASKIAVKTLESFLPSVQGYVLSYAPFRSELDITALNEILAQGHRLVLPKVVMKQLLLYRVDDLSTSLEVSPWGINEPIPARCKKIDETEITLALIPGVAFDANNYRLGYGKGFYDDLIPKLIKATTIGIGFEEQKVDKLPIDPWDHPLQKVMLF